MNFQRGFTSWDILKWKVKMAFCPFFLKYSTRCPMSETNLRNIQFKTRFLENRVIANWNFKFFFFGTRVPCEVLEFMELEFLEKIQVELEFHELEYFTWNLSSKKKKKKNPRCMFAIIWCSKNRVTFETRFLENWVSKQGYFPN